MVFKLSDFVAPSEREYLPVEIYSIEHGYSKTDKVIVFDLDVLAYRCSAACESSYLFTNEHGDEFQVKSKKAFKEYCLENNLEYESFTSQPKQVADPISYCLKTVNDSIKKVMEFVGANKCEFYLGGSNNFRLKVPTPIEYKSSRTPVSKPLLLNDVREYLIKHKGAKKVTTQETDDVVAHRMRTLYKQGVRATLYSCDKDALGNVDHKLQMYDPIKEDIIVSEGGVGNIEIVKGKLKGKGLKFLIYQFQCCPHRLLRQ